MNGRICVLLRIETQTSMSEYRTKRSISTWCATSVESWSGRSSRTRPSRLVSLADLSSMLIRETW